MQKNFFNKKNMIVLGSIVFILVIVSTLFIANYIKSTIIDNLNFKIVADKSTELGVETNTSFLLTSEKNYSTKALKEIISLEPSMEFSLDKVDKCAYLITPSEELADNSLYNIYISDAGNKPALSWAFQTKTNFKVTSTLPQDAVTYVDVNSGIEIYFSKPVKDINNFFQISPNVGGSFEYIDKRVIFKPKKLDFDTPYEVTIKKGLKNAYGEELLEDFRFAFRTKDDGNDYFYLQNDYQQSFIPDENPNISLTIDEMYKNDKFKVNVYKLNNVQEYVNFLQIHSNEVNKKIGKSNDYNFDMSSHSNIMNFEAKLIEKENTWGYQLDFPEKLEKGWYIADVTTSNGKIHFQKAIQITNISVYAYSLNKEVQIWCNNSETGLPMSGATVQIGDLAAITNKDGIASFNVNDKNEQKVFVTSKDGIEFGEYINFIGEDEVTLNDKYYTYLYTDRDKYFPTDKINIWGAIIPKRSDAQAPNDVTIEVGNKSIKAEVNANGIFKGELNISNYSSNTWFGINLKVNDLVQYMKGIEVVDYIKPVYKLSSHFDKEYYRGSEPITLNVSGKFYDGTSAENVKVKVSYANQESKIVTLDENGEAKTVIKPFNYEEDSAEMQYAYSELEVAGIDEYASSYNNTLYFPTDYHVSSEWNHLSSKLKFSTNKVNYNAITNGTVDYERIYTGESFNQRVSVNIIKTDVIKTQISETYNYYTSTMEPTYKYENIDTIVDTLDVNITAGQDYLIELPYYSENNYSYKAECKFILPDGYVGKNTTYLYKNDGYGVNKYYFEREYKKLKLNETATLTLKSNGAKMDAVNMLYFVSTDKINKLGVTKTGTVDVKMDKELIPNCLVTGAAFDGKKVYEITEDIIYFDYEDNRLNIKIETDKDVYKPGDKVNAKITVMDANGKPVNTDLLVSVVDEATLSDQKVDDPLLTIYQPRHHFPQIFVSNVYDKFEGGEGGGGEDESREKFDNVILFDSISTDSSGKAEVEFEMSDDLTSWRVTAIAVSKNGMAGSNSKNISTTIPFFINQVINEKYTSKDDVTLSARVAGNTVKLFSGMVRYEAKIEGKEAKEIVVKPSDVAIFNFGKLPLGTYKVTISANCGEYKDSITKEIAVVESLSDALITKNVNIDNISELNVTGYPIKLKIFNKGNELYYRSLQKVLEQSNGMTSEQIFAKNYASKKLNEFYGKDIYDVNFDMTFQDYTGGVSKLSYSEADPLLTAKLCKVAPEYINQQYAIEYFNRIIENSESLPNEVTAAYMGLAGLKQPVLNDVRYLLENSTGLELLDKINLIIALAYIGDYDSVKYYYDKEISGIIKTDGEYTYLDDEYEPNNYQASSELMSVLALIRNEKFESMLKYVLDNSSKEYISVMDLLVYVNSYNPSEFSNSWLKYELNGKDEYVDFSKEKIKILELDESEKKNLKINKHSENIGVIAEYTGNISEANNIGDNVTIKKTMSAAKMGDYTNVTLDITVKNNDGKYYNITDFIPTSSRYTSNNYSYNQNWGFSGYENQKVNFYVRTGQTNNFKINYKIRNVLKGKYYVDSAFATDENGCIVGKSNDLIFDVQ